MRSNFQAATTRHSRHLSDILVQGTGDFASLAPPGYESRSLRVRNEFKAIEMGAYVRYFDKYEYYMNNYNELLKECQFVLDRVTICIYTN